MTARQDDTTGGGDGPEVIECPPDPRIWATVNRVNAVMAARVSPSKAVRKLARLQMEMVNREADMNRMLANIRASARGRE